MHLTHSNSHTLQSQPARTESGIAALTCNSGRFSSPCDRIQSKSPKCPPADARNGCELSALTKMRPRAISGRGDGFPRRRQAGENWPFDFQVQKVQMHQFVIEEKEESDESSEEDVADDTEEDMDGVEGSVDDEAGGIAEKMDVSAPSPSEMINNDVRHPSHPPTPAQAPQQLPKSSVICLETFTVCFFGLLGLFSPGNVRRETWRPGLYAGEKPLITPFLQRRHRLPNSSTNNPGSFPRTRLKPSRELRRPSDRNNLPKYEILPR